MSEIKVVQRLAFRDRTIPSNVTYFISLEPAGDAYPPVRGTQNTWTLEANGRCNATGNAPQNVAEGPGGGEFYFGDAYDLADDFISPALTILGKGGNHADTGNGGVEVRPGSRRCDHLELRSDPGNPKHAPRRRHSLAEQHDGGIYKGLSSL